MAVPDRFLHGRRRCRSRGADSSCAKSFADARVFVSRVCADLRGTANLLGCTFRAVVKASRGRRHCTHQQHRHHERDCEPVGIGIVRTRTGSIDDAIYVIAALPILSGIALLASVRPTQKR
jgi:hypothetical protein